MRNFSLKHRIFHSNGQAIYLHIKIDVGDNILKECLDRFHFHCVSHKCKAIITVPEMKKRKSIKILHWNNLQSRCIYHCYE